MPRSVLLTKLLVLSLLLLMMILSACGSSPEPVNPNEGRYAMQQDRAPARPVDLTTTPDVIPEPVRRGSAGNRSPYTILGSTYHVMTSEAGYREQGVASWYGEKFHGHRTSNGEIFDMYRYSAAHRTLPIPSFLRVTNLDNNRSLIVRVNDRGPFHGGRLIDLSYAAAVRLGYADRGTARVLVESVLPESDANVGTNKTAAVAQPGAADEALHSPAIDGKKYLQVGAFSSLDSARSLSEQLQGMTPLPVLVRSIQTPEQGVLHRVRIGPVEGDAEIRRLRQRVVAANLGRPYTVTE